MFASRSHGKKERAVTKPMAAKLLRYFRIWRRSIVVNFSILAASRIDFVTFVVGKLIRTVFLVIFMLAIFDHVPTVAGYGRGEAVLFFAVMNVVDVIFQVFWFRGLTDLQRLIRTGDFDLVLTKPMSPLFWASFRITDFFDIATIPVALYFLWYAFSIVSVPITGAHIVLGPVLVLCGLVITYAINLAMASLTFWITEMDNAWWTFRDAFYVARFPPEVFPFGVRVFFTFLVPVLVVVAFPTKGFLGILSPWLVAWAGVASMIFLTFAIWLWRLAIRHYSSASA